MTVFVVDYVAQLPASLGPRGGLDVVGTIIQRDKGQFRTQSEVVIEVEGREPRRAWLAGIAMSVPPPKIAVVLQRVSLGDVPIGARVRTLEAAERL
jgi:hypothetical protein